MSGLNSNGLTVYLSKNMGTSDSVLSSYRKKLQKLGYSVREYEAETTYSDYHLKDSDFVVFLPPKNIKDILPVENRKGRIEYRHFVGKGQFTEAQLCKKIGKPAFVIHEETWEGDLLVSKLVDEHIPAYSNFTHEIFDMNDWKVKFGTIASYTRGELVNLSHFIDIYFAKSSNPFKKTPLEKWQDCIIQYPLTPSEAFKLPDPKLLLL